MFEIVMVGTDTKHVSDFSYDIPNDFDCWLLLLTLTSNYNKNDVRIISIYCYQIFYLEYLY